MKLFLRVGFFIVLLLSTSFLPYGCISSTREDQYPELLSPNLANIVQSKSGIKLPNNHHELHAYEESGLDWMMRFSFKMDRSEMDQFIKDSKFQGKLERNPIDRAVYSSQVHQWFDPDKSKDYLAGQYFSKGEKLAKAKKMLIDLDDPKIVTVYIQVFSI
jgi:hypothetical protein